jgi:CTP:molybdopterin cytidylyltransferase MocA
MGQPKLLLPLASRTLIEVVIDAWQQGGVDRVIVVCRAADTDLIAICEKANAMVVTPATPPPEMKDSVAEALRYLAQHFQPASRDTWLLAPADLPQLSAAVIGKLLESHRPERPQILVPTQEGRRGHPLLFPCGLAEEVFGLAENEGVNLLLKRHSVREIACGVAALPADVDTPADYRSFR